MTGTNIFLFVYGTLLDERNPFGALLKNSCTYYKKGRFKGELFDLGEYPGALFNPDTEHFVHGNIFEMSYSEHTLKMLDDYEGFGNAYPQPNEFTRELRDVETDDGSSTCWIYLYNGPIEGHWLIASGNYMEYIGIRSF